MGLTVGASNQGEFRVRHKPGSVIGG